jgi:hypothetical protein
MFIPDPDLYLSRIPDPESKKTAKKEEGEKRLVVLPFFSSHKFNKLEIILFLNKYKKNLRQWTKNCSTFYPKNFHLSLRNMDWGTQDPGGTGKKLSRIPDPGVYKALDSGSGSSTLLICTPSTYHLLCFIWISSSSSVVLTTLHY